MLRIPHQVLLSSTFYYEALCTISSVQYRIFKNFSLSPYPVLISLMLSMICSMIMQTRKVLRLCSCLMLASYCSKLSVWLVLLVLVYQYVSVLRFSCMRLFLHLSNRVLHVIILRVYISVAFWSRFVDFSFTVYEYRQSLILYSGLSKVFVIFVEKRKWHLSSIISELENRKWMKIGKMICRL